MLRASDKVAGKLERATGLSGENLSLDQLADLPWLRAGGNSLRKRLSKNFGMAGSEGEPTVKAAVLRRFEAGEVICEAGSYGSTAFILVEGSATAEVPRSTRPASVRGRKRSSLARLRRAFSRHRGEAKTNEVDSTAIGEISAFAVVSCERPPARQELKPGDLFGIDTCINFYPREATVIAKECCVVVEMLRSVGNVPLAVDPYRVTAPSLVAS